MSNDNFSSDSHIILRHGYPWFVNNLRFGLFGMGSLMPKFGDQIRMRKGKYEWIQTKINDNLKCNNKSHNYT